MNCNKPANLFDEKIITDTVLDRIHQALPTFAVFRTIGGPMVVADLHSGNPIAKLGFTQGDRWMATPHWYVEYAHTLDPEPDLEAPANWVQADFQRAILPYQSVKAACSYDPTAFVGGFFLVCLELINPVRQSLSEHLNP